MFDFSGYVFYHIGDGGAQSFFSVFLCVLRGCVFFTTEGMEWHRDFLYVFLCVLSGCVFLPQSVRRGTEFFSQWLCFFTTEGMEGNRGFFYVNLLRKIKDLSRFIQ